MKELFKKTVSAVYISEEKEYLSFIVEYGGECLTYYAEGGCCSSSWFESINNLENIIGEEIIGIEEKPECDPDGPLEDPDKCITVYGYTLKTIKGYTDIELRNSSNGYYGGSCEFIPDTELEDPYTGIKSKIMIKVQNKQVSFNLYK